MSEHAHLFVKLTQNISPFQTAMSELSQIAAYVHHLANLLDQEAKAQTTGQASPFTPEGKQAMIAALPALGTKLGSIFNIEAPITSKLAPLSPSRRARGAKASAPKFSLGDQIVGDWKSALQPGTIIAMSEDGSKIAVVYAPSIPPRMYAWAGDGWGYASGGTERSQFRVLKEGTPPIIIPNEYVLLRDEESKLPKGEGRVTDVSPDGADIVAEIKWLGINKSMHFKWKRNGWYGDDNVEYTIKRLSEQGW